MAPKAGALLPTVRSNKLWSGTTAPPECQAGTNDNYEQANCQTKHQAEFLRKEPHTGLSPLALTFQIKRKALIMLEIPLRPQTLTRLVSGPTQGSNPRGSLFHRSQIQPITDHQYSNPSVAGGTILSNRLNWDT